MTWSYRVCGKFRQGITAAAAAAAITTTAVVVAALTTRTPPRHYHIASKFSPRTASRLYYKQKDQPNITHGFKLSEGESSVY